MLVMMRCFVSGLIAVFAVAAGAFAEVQATFYSQDLGGDHFPHAFVMLEGTLSDGTVVDENYGFRPLIVSPALLMASVRGTIRSVDENYVSKSDAQFSVAITDEQYAAIVQLQDDWNTQRGRTYNLNRRNCVHFTGAVAETLGLETNTKSKFFKKPKGYLREIVTLNADYFALAEQEAHEAEQDANEIVLMEAKSSMDDTSASE